MSIIQFQALATQTGFTLSAVSNNSIDPTATAVNQLTSRLNNTNNGRRSLRDAPPLSAARIPGEHDVVENAQGVTSPPVIKALVNKTYALPEDALNG